MTWTLRVAEHEVRLGHPVLECFRDGVFVAGVYPHEDSIRIVSKFIEGVTEEAGPPPSVIVKLREG